MGAMHRVMIFNNFNHEITSNGLEDNIETRIVEETQSHPQNRDNNIISKPRNTFTSNVSISEELLNYSTLMDKGLITKDEFTRIKNKLLGGLLN